MNSKKEKEKEKNKHLYVQNVHLYSTVYSSRTSKIDSTLPNAFENINYESCLPSNLCLPQFSGRIISQTFFCQIQRCLKLISQTNPVYCQILFCIFCVRNLQKTFPEIQRGFPSTLRMLGKTGDFPFFPTKKFFNGAVWPPGAEKKGKTKPKIISHENFSSVKTQVFPEKEKDWNSNFSALRRQFFFPFSSLWGNFPFPEF